MSSDQAGAGMEEISYEEFGVRFFEYAVKAERIEAGFAGLEGEKVGFEPKALMRLLKVGATGSIGETVVTQTGHSPVTFHATIPIDLAVSIQVAAIEQRFQADIRVGLTLTACALEPLRIYINVRPPRAKDVQVQLETRDLGVTVINALGTIEQELRRIVAWQVRQRLDAPDMQAARDFDIAARIEGD